MAKKRAQIDVTLTVTAASDIFDQDIEDLSPEVREAIVGENGAGKKEPPTVSRKSDKQPSDTGNGKIQPAQLRAIYPMLKKLGVSEDQKHVFCAKTLGIKGLKSLNDLTPEQGRELIQKLMSAEPATEPEPTTVELMDEVTPDDIRDIFARAGYAEDQILSKIGTILQEPPKKAIEDYSDQALRDVAAWMVENEQC
jgi:DNA-directed RNA polymerase subunit F